MSWTVEAISEDAPSGENLEYDPEFSALEHAATPGQERQAGDEILAPAPLNHQDIISKAEAIMARSHDIRAGVFMAHAQVALNGFVGFGPAVGYIFTCLEQFWDTCHPQLDDEDDDDPTMRINAVRGLADRDTILKAVRQAPLTLSMSFGRVSILDLEIANGDAAPSDDVPPMSDSAISAAFRDTDPDQLREILAGAQEALTHVRAIDALFDEKTPGQGPDLAPLVKLLHRAVTRLVDETGGEEMPEEDAAEDAAEDGGTAPKAAAASTGAITSSRDVTAALDRILAYYATNEPSSPLPILIRRAKRLVGADFMTILQDVAPDGIANVSVISGPDEAQD